jgi:hypothetical protein
MKVYKLTMSIYSHTYKYKGHILFKKILNVKLMDENGIQIKQFETDTLHRIIRDR